MRYDYDPALAKKLLAEAVADGTFDPNRVYKLYAPSTPRPYMPQPERVARFLQASLEQVGIHTELVLQPYAAAPRRRSQAGEHDLCVFGWIGDTGDPDNFLYVLFHSDNANTEPARRTSRSIASPRSTSMLREAQSRRRRADARAPLRGGAGPDRGRRAVGADRALASSSSPGAPSSMA